MCIRRNEQTYTTNETKKKKKLSCRQRCARRCRKFFCNRIKRCVKKKIFGVPDPLAGIDLGNLKSKLKLNATGSILNVLNKNIDKNDAIVGELKRKYSIKGSKEKVFTNMLNDYKKGKLLLSLSKLQNSKLDLRDLDKHQINNLIKDYEAAQRQKYKDLNAKDLKNKFSVNTSQEKVLGRMIEDLKKGNLSATEISNDEFDPKKLDQDKLNSMLQKYQTRPSFVAKKFSLKGSKANILEKFLQDHNKGKFSATKFTSKTVFDPNKLNKDQLNDILSKYDAEQKTKPLFAESKGKIQKLFEDLKSLRNHPSLIEQVKKKFLNS